MADYKLSYTGDQTDEALGKAMKAVLTEAQNLTPVQQEQVRKNIGAGTSNFSGSYNDLTDKPDVEPVKDVQVGGTSVLADGVANVPIASVTNIDSRASKSVITPGNIDYAVKAAMCDGKGAAWTEDEQKAARERMGVDKPYELIEEIVLSEDTGSIVRTTTPTGTSYNYSAIQIEIVGKNASGSNGFVNFGASSSTFSVVDGAISGNQENYHVYCKIEIKNQMVDALANTAPGYQGQLSRRYRVITPETAGWPEGAITGIRIACDGLIVAGATISIYGVRA